MIEVQADLKVQFDLQWIADDIIYHMHNIQSGYDKKDELVLAVFDEICELMNKMRIHKFWSNKEMDERAELLEEYVDTWHFILSIGNIIQVPTSHFGIEIKKTFTDQFRAALFLANDVFTPIGWHLFTNHWKGLGVLMGFSDKEVIEAFNRKHDINVKRQLNGY